MKNFSCPMAAMFAVLCLTAATAFAQTSQSVGSTATVTTPITAAATAPLTFGSVTKGSANTIAATSASASALYFSGDEADNVDITVPATATISTTSGSGADMTVTLNRAAMTANSVDDVQGNATTADASSGSVSVALSNDAGGDGVDLDGLGEAYLWLGGSVTPGAAQQRGTYSGTFSVSASYSN